MLLAQNRSDLFIVPPFETQRNLSRLRLLRKRHYSSVWRPVPASRTCWCMIWEDPPLFCSDGGSKWESVSMQWTRRVSGGEVRVTHVRALKDEAVGSRRRADLHVEGVAFVVELCDAAEGMHDLHVLQCREVVMSYLKVLMWEVEAVHRTFVLGFMTPTPCLLMTTQTLLGQLGSNVCCKEAWGQSHWRHAVRFKNLLFSVWLTLTSKKVQPKVGQVAMVSRKMVLASCTVIPLCWL